MLLPGCALCLPAVLQLVSNFVLRLPGVRDNLEGVVYLLLLRVLLRKRPVVLKLANAPLELLFLLGLV